MPTPQNDGDTAESSAAPIAMPGESDRSEREVAATTDAPANAPGESTFVEGNGVRLHAVAAGPTDGPLVLLLHGFPEFWYAWRDLIRPLADAGFRVVAPDQRGYNRSDKPDAVGAYHLDALAGDAVRLIRAVDRESAAVVGHDWGALVGWWTALHYPSRVDCLCAMNVPHPTALRRALGGSWEQRLRSGYALLFQIPRLAEAALRIGNYRPLTASMRRTSREGAFAERDFDRYREAWDRPGALPGMLNWYRCLARARPRPETDRVRPSALLLWGSEEQFVKPTTARESAELCDDARVEFFEGATHWLHHEEPERVAATLVGFLR